MANTEHGITQCLKRVPSTSVARKLELVRVLLHRVVLDGDPVFWIRRVGAGDHDSPRGSRISYCETGTGNPWSRIAWRRSVSISLSVARLVRVPLVEYQAQHTHSSDSSPGVAFENRSCRFIGEESTPPGGLYNELQVARDRTDRCQIQHEPFRARDRDPVDQSNVSLVESAALVHDKIVLDRSLPARTSELYEIIAAARQLVERSPGSVRDRCARARCKGRGEEIASPGRRSPGSAIDPLVHTTPLILDSATDLRLGE